MAKVPLRRVLSRLTALALTTTSVGPAAAALRPEARCEDCDDLGLEDDRAVDHGPLDSNAAAHTLGRGLALALAELRPIEATQLASTWALSPDPLRRQALAVSLEWLFPLVGDGLVIEHLARDPEPGVRAAAARAAWIRRSASRAPIWGELFARLADDPDPDVRAVVAAHG
jgi:hypothetical protein